MNFHKFDSKTSNILFLQTPCTQPISKIYGNNRTTFQNYFLCEVCNFWLIKKYKVRKKIQGP